MLDALTLALLNLSDAIYSLIGYALLVVGAIIGWRTDRSETTLNRAPYFALTGLVLLVINASSLGSLLSPEALSAGVFWLVVLLEFIALVIGGFLIARLARSRSRDHAGNARYAAFAFFPIFNLILTLVKPKEQAGLPALRTPRLFKGVPGVLIGFTTIYAGFALASWSEMRVLERLQTFEALPPKTELALLRFNIWSKGLEDTLVAEAASLRTPIFIDGSTTLVQVRADKKIFERTFAVAIDEPEPDANIDFIAQTAEFLCSDGYFATLLDAGGQIDEIYQTTDGYVIFKLSLTQEECDRLVN